MDQNNDFVYNYVNWPMLPRRGRASSESDQSDHSGLPPPKRRRGGAPKELKSSDDEITSSQVSIFLIIIIYKALICFH